MWINKTPQPTAVPAMAELDVGIKQFDHFQMIFLIFRKIVIYAIDPEPDSVFVITA